MAEFKLKLSLKRISMIFLSELLWKSPDVKYEINKFNYLNMPEFDLKEKTIRYCNIEIPTDSASNLSFYKYFAWEEIIECVLNKTELLFLPLDLKEDLQTMIILMGRKIFYFYDEFRESSTVNLYKIPREYFRCKKCIKAAGTEHFYSFTLYGTVLFQCPLLHPRSIPPQGRETFEEFLNDVVCSCDVETIEKYKDDIVRFLRSVEPGLKFENQNEVPFSIICLWKIMKPNWVKVRGNLDFYSNGYVRLPKKYLSRAKEFKLPLEALPQLCVKLNPTEFQYFAGKLSSFGDQDLFSLMVQVVMAYDESLLINNRLHFFPAPDYCQAKIMTLLHLMSAEETFDFLEKHSNNLLLYFLPVWPHQEIVPEILDFCEIKDFNLDYKFLLQLITFCIAIENVSRFKVHKKFYLNLFDRVWLKASKQNKMDIFLRKTRLLIAEDSNNPILTLILKPEDIEKCAKFSDHKEELHSAIFFKWQKLLRKENFGIVKNFVNGLVFLKEEFQEFLNDYLSSKYEERSLTDYDFVI